MRKKEKYLVVAAANGVVRGTHEELVDAVAEAQRLASKEKDEFIVFFATKRVRPKPSDIETVEA